MWQFYMRAPTCTANRFSTVQTWSLYICTVIWTAFAAVQSVVSPCSSCYLLSPRSLTVHRSRNRYCSRTSASKYSSILTLSCFCIDLWPVFSSAALPIGWWEVNIFSPSQFTRTARSSKIRNCLDLFGTPMAIKTSSGWNMQWQRSRDYQGKRVNPQYRPYIQGNSS